jgi:hypothetical protein
MINRSTNPNPNPYSEDHWGALYLATSLMTSVTKIVPV